MDIVYGSKLGWIYFLINHNKVLVVKDPVGLFEAFGRQLPSDVSTWKEFLNSGHLWPSRILRFTPCGTRQTRYLRSINVQAICTNSTTNVYQTFYWVQRLFYYPELPCWRHIWHLPLTYFSQPRMSSKHLTIHQLFCHSTIEVTFLDTDRTSSTDVQVICTSQPQSDVHQTVQNLADPQWPFTILKFVLFLADKTSCIPILPQHHNVV